MKVQQLLTVQKNNQFQSSSSLEDDNNVCLIVKFRKVHLQNCYVL